MRSLRRPVRCGWMGLSALLGMGFAGCGDQVYLGLRIEDANSTSRSAVMINQVDPGTLFNAAGFEPNDIIVSFNNQGVTTVAALQQNLASIALGTTFTVRVYRLSTGQIVQADVTLTADPDNMPTSLGVYIRNAASPVGVAVVSVDGGSAADQGGLLAGDVITKFGATSVGNTDQFRRALAAAAVNSSVTVSFRRGADVTDQTTTVTIRFDVVSRFPLLGVTAQDLTPQLADALGYPALGGAKVTASLIDGTAFDAGIMPLDLILRYNDTEINDTSDLVKAVRGQGGTGDATIIFSRAGDVRSVTFALRGRLPSGTYTTDVGVSLTELIGGGLPVVALTSGGPAAKAELEVGDIITAVRGHAVGSVQAFYKEIAAALAVKPAIQGVALTTIRDGVQVSRYMQIRTSSTSGGSAAKSIPWEM